MDDKKVFLACSALVCLAAALVALSGGITINVNHYAQTPQSLSDGPHTASESISSAGEEQFFTSSPEEYTSSDFIYDPTLPYDAVYGQPGVFDIEQELNTVTLKADGAVLKNKTIHRNVLITAESGVVVIENCTIEGSIKVTAGASLVLKNVTAQRVEVNTRAMTDVRLENSEVSICDVYTSCSLTGDGFARVRTQSGAGLVTIKLTLRDMTLSELTVVESVTVTLEDAKIESTTGSDNLYYE